MTQLDDHSLETTVAYPGEYAIHDEGEDVRDRVFQRTGVKIRTED